VQTRGKPPLLGTHKGCPQRRYNKPRVRAPLKICGNTKTRYPKKKAHQKGNRTRKKSKRKRPKKEEHPINRSGKRAKNRVKERSTGK